MKEEKNLPGERWKTISGFEDYYQVSSLGRVKSLDRYIPHPTVTGRFSICSRKDLSQKIIEHRNIKTGKPSIDLQVSLSRDGNMKFFNVRRLVYSAFIEQVIYDEDGMYVINKNGNGFNCSVKNLKLVSKSEKSRRAFDRGRVVESYLKTADRSKKYISYEASYTANCTWATRCQV